MMQRNARRPRLCLVVHGRKPKYALLVGAERVAPCIPGADISERCDDGYAAGMVMRVGSMKLALDGSVATLDQDDGDRSADQDAGNRGPERLDEDHPAHTRRRCAERHANADFGQPARDDLADHRIHAGDGEQQRQESEARHQPREQHSTAHFAS